uniref:RING-type domain-containing protein n=1 Tax=Romanomermis culicivorax TaxID=13658 RepID=A0A915JW92_ROMCU
MEIFPSIPLILSCGHSYCEMCLRQMIKCAPTNDQYSLDCPTCRIVTRLPLASSESTLCQKSIKKINLSKILPKNYLMENIFDDLKIVSQKVEPFIYLDETTNITNQRLTAELRLIQQKVDKLNKKSIENNTFIWQVITMLLGALLIKQMYDQYP